MKELSRDVMYFLGIDAKVFGTIQETKPEIYEDFCGRHI